MNRSKLILPILILGLFISPLFNKTALDQYAQIPVQEGGRIKPIDSLARNSLISIQGKQNVQTDHGKITPIEWFLELQSNPEKTDTYEIFLIENPQVFSFLGDQYYKQKYRVSFNHLVKYEKYIMAQSEQAEKIEANKRSPLQEEFVTLKNRMIVYSRLKNSISFELSKNLSQDIKTFQNSIPDGIEQLERQQHKQELYQLNVLFKQFKVTADNAMFAMIPPEENAKKGDWQEMGNAILQSLNPNTPQHPLILLIAATRDSYQENDMEKFKSSTAAINEYYTTHHPKILRHVKLEHTFNTLEFFFKSYILYILCIFAIITAWILKNDTLRIHTHTLFTTITVIYTIAILLRMIIQGRPPVTNLYSSAIFVGYIAILIAEFIERIEKNGIGVLVGSVIGASSLIIAHFLSLSGDTLEMMQAVLDSNFWLSTHVIIITMGYSAVFFAGLLAHIYIFSGFLTKHLTKERAKRLTTLTYGTIATALLLSFIGTVLGGIWGDQSWGRFWGWDPKENGAMLIVLWTAIILHARLCGWVKDRGIMVMAAFGNIVCSFSWFGVNLLGIGLHSYGFTEKGFYWLISFWASQVIVMMVGMMPKPLWTSFRTKEK